MAQPLKAAIPATAATVVPPLQVRTAPLVPLPGVMATLTASELVVTVLPPASLIAMAGWGLSGAATPAPPGWVRTASWLGGPTVVSNGFDVAGVRLEAVAVRR